MHIHHQNKQFNHSKKTFESKTFLHAEIQTDGTEN